MRKRMKYKDSESHSMPKILNSMKKMSWSGDMRRRKVYNKIKLIVWELNWQIVTKTIRIYLNQTKIFDWMMKDKWKKSDSNSRA